MGKAATVLANPPIVPTLYRIEASKLRFAREAPKELGLQVRKSSDRNAMSDAELEALIRHHGILIPLVFKRHDGQLYVTAGNRRLRMVRKIDGEGSNRYLPALDTDELTGDDRAIAHATNAALPVHPVDRFELISSYQKTLSAVDIQERFGLSARQYAQTMRLAGMAPIVREAWREGQINSDIARAFALSDDPAQQEKIFKSLIKDDNVSEHAVRSRLIGNQHQIGPMVEFVGVAECIKAGVHVNEDLFGTVRHTVAQGDISKLKKLVDQKIEAECARLIEAGWSFAVPKDAVQNNWFYYGTQNPSGKAEASEEQQARLDAVKAALANADADSTLVDDLEEEVSAIEEEIKANAYSEAQRKKGGCFVSFTNGGKLSVEYGRTKPEERKAAAAVDRRENGTAKAKPKPAVGGAVISQALAWRLSDQLTNAIGAALAKQPQLALAALVAGFASDGVACEVRNMWVRQHSNKKPSFEGIFDANRGQTLENLAVMLAQVAQQAMNFRVHNAEVPPLKQKGAMEVCTALSAKTALIAEVRKAFDAKDYFASIGREAIAVAVEEAMGTDHAAKVRKMDKEAATKFAAANLPGTGWLPVWLRVPGYDGPSGAEKVKPAKKAAAKKAAKKRTAK